MQPDSKKQITYDVQGERLVLLPQRAVWWQRKKTLIVADLHAGKIGHFQTYGLAVPDTGARADLDLLTALIRKFNVKRLLMLGDVFHSTGNNEWQSLYEWREGLEDCSVEIVPGNHDIHIGLQTIQTGGFIVHNDTLYEPPFLFMHDPALLSAGVFHEMHGMAGHLHPSIQLRGPAKDRLRLRCFIARPHMLILPAFGRFTGHNLIRPMRDDIVMAIDDDTIRTVTTGNRT